MGLVLSHFYGGPEKKPTLYVFFFFYYICVGGCSHLGWGRADKSLVSGVR